MQFLRKGSGVQMILTEGFEGKLISVEGFGSNTFLAEGFDVNLNYKINKMQCLYYFLKPWLL